MTSFDWSAVDNRLVGTSSIDTTCTIWELETGAQLARLRSPAQGTFVVRLKSEITGQLLGHVKTQLIAHENEVYDIAFSKCTAHGFASVGGDGSGISLEKG